MSKHNYFVIFLKKINLSINNLLEKYLNKLKFDNFTIIARSNKVFLTFVTFIILFLSYLSIPYAYNKFEIQKELKNQILNKFNLDLIFSNNFNYKFFPRPHFVIENSSIFDDQLMVSDIKKLKVFISLNNLFSLKNIIVKDVILEKTNFYLNKQNSNFFINILNNKFLESSLIIKDSNIFFNNNDQEILFLNKILKMKYYYDPKELKNIVKSKNEIFNIPYSFELNKDKNKKKIFSKININFLNFQIENIFDYTNDQNKGLSNIIYNKDKNRASYEWSKNYFKFNLSDRLDDPQFFYYGNVNFNPFYSVFEGNTDQLNLSYLSKENSIFSQLFKTEILNNKNLNIDLKIKAKKIFQLQSFTDVILNFKIQEGLIDIDNTKFSWNGLVDFKISDSLLYVNQNQLILDGKLVLNIRNLNEIYKFLQSSKNLRPELKKIEFNFNYNFDERIISFDVIKIDNKNNKKVNDVLKKITLKNDKLQNKIFLKNIMKNILAVYAG